MKKEPTWLEADCDNGCTPIPGTTICPTCDAPEDWYDRIACKDQPIELFFGGAASDRLAIRLCAVCPVRAYCLEKGWDEPAGVWGGFTEGQRRGLQGTLQLERVGRRQGRRAIREIATRPLNPR